MEDSQAQLDEAQVLFEAGQIMESAEVLRSLTLEADEAGDAELRAEIDDMVGQMRRHLADSPELADFDSALVEPEAAEIAPAIDAPAEVRKYIRERGGRLFLWLEDVGHSGWTVETTSTSTPAGDREFKEYDAVDFTLFVQSGFEPPKVKLRLRHWWPLAPISVWTGAEVGDRAGYATPPGDNVGGG